MILGAILGTLVLVFLLLLNLVSLVLFGAYGGFVVDDSLPVFADDIDSNGTINNGERLMSRWTWEQHELK